MIGLLRLIGVFNAAIWLGGVVFFTVVTGPALASESMSAVLQPKNFPYFSPAIQHVVLLRYFEFSIVCALIALLHLIVEWVYMGRLVSRKGPLALLAGLLVYGMVGSNLLQPHLKSLHTTRYSAKATPAERAAAARSFDRWRVVLVLMNVSAIGGLTFHFWRVTKPVDTARFVSSVKFRG